MRTALILAFAVLLAPVSAKAADGVPAGPPTNPPVAAVQKRPAALMSLYAGSIALQTFDTYSTLTAVRASGVEQNPLVRGLTQNPAGFIVLKSGVTVASIYAAEHLWKHGHRVQAIAMIAITNGLMTAVAVNNGNALRRLQ